MTLTEDDIERMYLALGAIAAHPDEMYLRLDRSITKEGARSYDLSLIQPGEESSAVPTEYDGAGPSLELAFRHLVDEITEDMERHITKSDKRARAVREALERWKGGR